MRASFKQTIRHWLYAISALALWAYLTGTLDEQKRLADDAFKRQGEMMANATKNAAAFALCKSENATPVWTSDTNVDCLTTKGRTASRQVVAGSDQ